MVLSVTAIAASLALNACGQKCESYYSLRARMEKSIGCQFLSPYFDQREGKVLYVVVCSGGEEGDYYNYFEKRGDQYCELSHLKKVF